ncbi:MAG TPA: LysE family translocator [Gemmatimonadales bacterium]|nr:LysE family translocator [Gemmatimonadales bacterium]
MTPLFDGPTLLTFGLAAAALVAAPGPGQALVLTRTLQGGTRAGVWTALGLEIGTAVHTLAAALGLSAILATSATAFAVVKFLGAGYLIFLGIRALRTPVAGPADASAPQDPPPTAHLLAQATVTGILNPKVAIFFLAFLPQFVDPARGNPFLQFVLLGFGFAVLGVLGDGLVAAVAGRARHRVVTGPGWARWRERLTGGVLVALGIRLAFESRR